MSSHIIPSDSISQAHVHLLYPSEWLIASSASQHLRCYLHASRHTCCLRL